MKYISIFLFNIILVYFMSSKKKKYCFPSPTPTLNLPSINSKLISGPTSGPWSAFYKTDLEGNFCLVAKGNPYYL